jgi:hypothetical protein
MSRHGQRSFLLGGEATLHEPAGAADPAPFPEQRPLAKQGGLHAHRVEARHIAIRVDATQMHAASHGLSLEIVAKLTL